MSGSGISWAICKSAPRSRQVTRPVLHHCFLQAGCPACRPTNSVKALKAAIITLLFLDWAQTDRVSEGQKTVRKRVTHASKKSTYIALILRRAMVMAKHKQKSRLRVSQSVQNIEWKSEMQWGNQSHHWCRLNNSRKNAKIEWCRKDLSLQGLRKLYSTKSLITHAAVSYQSIIISRLLIANM